MKITPSAHRESWPYLDQKLFFPSDPYQTPLVLPLFSLGWVFRALSNVMQHCITQCPSGTLELHKHLLNPTHSGPNWIAQLISQSLGGEAHNLCLPESPAHVQSTILAFLSFFLRWSKSTVWKRRVTGVFCLPNVISITSLLPNSTQF